MIEFCKSVSDEECYITTTFKSYAHFYYAQVKGYNSKANNKEWVFSGDNDRTIYIISKKGKSDLTKHPQVMYLYEKNGYIFYKIPPKMN